MQNQDGKRMDSDDELSTPNMMVLGCLMQRRCVNDVVSGVFVDKNLASRVDFVLSKQAI